MGRFILYILVGIATSFFLFPIGFSFLPSSVNTKLILAVGGIILFGYKSIQGRGISISKDLGGATVLAALFSLINFISTDINGTTDYSYATYITSFFVWLASAHAVGSAIRLVHGIASFRLLTLYLVGVCVMQCAAALLIDNIPAVQIFVDSFVEQGQAFFQEVDRLYGIGAALDPAGVRFSFVLILIMGLLSKNEKTRGCRTEIILLLFAFFVIGIVGNMISRTTLVGLGIAMAYFVLSSGLFQVIVRYDSLKLGAWFAVILIVITTVATVMYQVDDSFRGHLRFAFEGFFNWIEEGEWRTDSTDKLNNVMWIWPEDLRTWIIGSGHFEGFVYSTDIGYCRFILYSGLVGFSVFALFFVYLAAVFAKLNPRYALMFFLLLVLAFVIWLKVATDIFQIFALFFCVDYFALEAIEIEEKNEDSI